MSESYRYTVRFPEPLTHYVEVEAVFPATSGSLELFLAVWTPGSYLIREYARHLEGIAAYAAEGEPLVVNKVTKNRWTVETRGTREVRVTYRLYCHDLSVRTNWVDERFTLLHGAATYLSVVGKLDRPHRVILALPEGWTAMPAADYEAADYDELVDTPVLAGNLAVHEFECGGKKHYLVNSDVEKLWDGGQSVADVAKIVEENRKLWGSLPYERYWFLNVLVDGPGGGGLEHKSSCCLIASRFATRTRAGYVKWLELVSHEFFHVWNVKRLRPKELGPFDYENEIYTKSLWFAEGFTEYYGSLLAARAGVTTREEYFTELSTLIETLQTTPGRFVRSAELSSFDTWIKLYRPDENSINSSISYYTKGAVIAFLFDAQLRESGRSLDEVMRPLYERYSGETGFPDDVLPELTKMTATTEELDYTAALQWFGLRFKAPVTVPLKAALGFTTKTDGGRLLITKVPRDVTGFSADDEILAIDNRRVLPNEWSDRMEQLRPGERVAILLSRSGSLVNVEATLTEDPGKRWSLEVNPDATADQQARLNAWLAPLPPPG